ncbi:MAG: hypothetical protein P8O70_15115 [SAR324 cluster bacterium]|nr:hypothetical protein [SAR324 cluster bacterium]
MTTTSSSFASDNLTLTDQSGTPSTSRRTVINNDPMVNSSSVLRQPIAFQLEEASEGHLFSQYFFDISRITSYDIPPVLNGLDNQTYSTLINANSGTFSIKKSQTFTDGFVINNPKYKKVIDNLSEPSLSADVDVTTSSFGKLWGFFFSSSESHRWLTIGAGLGITYTYGEYKVNVCDPYTVRGTLQPIGIGADSREGICLKKSNLYSKRLSNFGVGIAALIKLYSYIGDTFELNLVELDAYANKPIVTGDAEDDVFEVQYNAMYQNVLSLYVRF